MLGFAGLETQEDYKISESTNMNAAQKWEKYPILKLHNTPVLKTIGYIGIRQKSSTYKETVTRKLKGLVFISQPSLDVRSI